MKKIIVISLCLIFLFGFVNFVSAAPTFKVDLVYEVQQGDTLYDLSRKYDVPVSELRSANNLAANEAIKVGDELVIPSVNSSQLAQTSRQDNQVSLFQKQEKTEEYKLNCNQQYNIQIKKQSSDKSIDVSNLQTLKYYVRPGDNLYNLAQEFKTSIVVIKKLNNLDRSNVIRRGDKIKLPINNLTEKEVIYHTISDQNFELLARLIHGEARGESYIGQVAVGAVILNRVLSSYFPSDIRSVIYQPGQFSPVANGQINLRPNRTAYRAARAALQGQDPTRGACYFYNPRTAKNSWWFKTREVVVKIGNHVFAK